MATELAMLAAYRGLRQRLTSSPSSLWGAHAYGSRADSKAERPYVVYSIASSVQGDLTNEEELIIDVVCIADSVEQSMMGAAALDALVNEQGSQDRGCTTPLPTGAVWDCRTITREQTTHIPFVTETNEERYQTGGRYRFSMQLRP